MSLRPKITAATPPPMTDPVSPMTMVSQTGIGSGPGTAQRARPPMMNPVKIIETTAPNILRA
jgi:hypothetical protein